MSDLRDQSFWVGLFRKIFKILMKSAGLSSRRPTHNQHVVPHEEGWAVKGAGNERYTAIYERQTEAIERARSIAIGYRSDVIIHGRDGAIRDRMSYRK